MRRRELALRRRELSLAGVVLVIAHVAAGDARAQSSPDDLLERSRLRLESASAAERVAATADLRRAFAAGHVDAALAALDQWPPTPAMHLRGLLVDLPLARAVLLERACSGERAALARELLVETFRARADEQSPFRAELESDHEPRLPWSEHGVRVRRTGAPRAPVPWLELRRTLEDARVWSQPVVLFPGVAVAESAAMISAPLVEQAPAAGWLEVELLRRELVPQRSAMATWIVPEALAPKREASELPSGSEGELARQVIVEEKLFLRALESLAPLSPFEQGRRGADLLAQLGLPCTPLADRDDEFARGVAAGLALHRIGPLADSPGVATTTSNASNAANAPTAANAQAGPPRPNAAELRAIFEQTIERLRLEIEAEGPDPKPGPGPAGHELSDRIDALADRLEAEPLLGGELADLLRRSAAAQPEGSPLRTRLEQAASELWLLGRSARPGTRLVDLPPGAPPR